MRKLLLFYFALLFCSAQSFSQNLDSLYINYFQDTRELPYLHLNKTSFLKGEDIWFQAYVLEQNSNLLHPTTSNLYVTLFDELGNKKEQHLIHIKNGIGYANIPIDSTFTKDDYYIKASTNWMRNFNEDHSFTQKISILSDQKNKSKSLNEEDFFEFKLFPEGGHLLANTINNIGILIKNANNQGVKIKEGKVKTASGEIIAEFETNLLGFSNVNLKIKDNEIYTFEATLSNGTVLNKKTTLPKQTGVTINTLPLDDSFVLNILTNKLSLNQLADKKYRVLIHNTRSFKNIFFDFNRNDLTYALVLPKSELSKGVNIITIFNDNNAPILERLIFNEFVEFDNPLLITNSKAKNDSITTTLTNISNEKIVLSASFLPAETKAYKPNSNIKSQILLNPYIKGVIENPQYYFNNNYKDLDLLLLTQGWSKYSWDNIFNNATEKNYSFENGIDVTATFNKKIKSNQSVLMFSKENNLVRQITNTQTPLILENTFIKKHSTIDFGLRTNDNIFKISPSLSYSNTYINETFNSSNITNDKTIELEVAGFSSIFEDYTLLDEVILGSNKRELENNPYGAVSMLRSAKMENIMIPSGETIIEFLKFKGYGYSTATGFSPRGLISDNRQINSYDSEGAITGTTSASGNEDNEGFKRPTVRVYLDDKEVTFNLWVIENLNTNAVKEVFYGRDPGQLGEVIYIYTLLPQEYASNSSNFSTINFPVGFSTEKQYYSPKYPSYANSTFREFGALSWKPNMVIEANTSKKVTIPIYYQNEIKLFIEGVSESGGLISETQLLNID
ncbi:hypothetical protein [Olleya aquimaris]|uniref:MG2 domain-containing protein n=1 Tax=Olleya aquimaris TaxID=639310 RepID=A0A327RJI5_9FLAO|nr:hypothetical protein [Olleya aquimaris]RAJ17160.1 hypothetical protein LY08_00940 [Olleya aquimaris]